ncbi:hypothetical protein ACLB90_04190 [Stenotrophomonas sp. LGBM10]|uniref:hypothetical protein n=1 Tax=Stenotrophomonas sp. LGBM10 TaxID=3390038 RepID=UPI00398A8623
MTRHRPTLRRIALTTLALLPLAASAATPGIPTLAQAQSAMDALFDAALADRPATDSSRMVAEAFRPRLLALSSCMPHSGAAIPTVDCITTAQAGPEPVYRLLRFTHAEGHWTMPIEQRHLPVPVPPTDRVQVLLRETFIARAAQEADAGARADLAQAARTADVVGVDACDIGEDAPVIECQVSARVAGEQGRQPMAFIRVDGQWQNAPATPQ